MSEKRIKRLKNYKKLLIIICCLLFLSCSVYGIILYRDYTILKSSSVFANGPVGIIWIIPPEVHAYNRLKASPFAVQIFKALEKGGTNEGKLFALLALETLEIDYFNSLAEKYKGSYEKANCQFGCIVSSVYLRDLYEADKESLFPLNLIYSEY